MVPAITKVTFELLEAPSLLGEQVCMIIESEKPLCRALPPVFRVGDQPMRVGAFRRTDGALFGYLKDVPAPGDVVSAGWLGDEELEETSFSYQPDTTTTGTV